MSLGISTNWTCPLYWRTSKQYYLHLYFVNAGSHNFLPMDISLGAGFWVLRLRLSTGSWGAHGSIYRLTWSPFSVFISPTQLCFHCFGMLWFHLTFSGCVCVSVLEVKGERVYHLFWKNWGGERGVSNAPYVYFQPVFSSLVCSVQAFSWSSAT